MFWADPYNRRTYRNIKYGLAAYSGAVLSNYLSGNSFFDRDTYDYSRFKSKSNTKQMSPIRPRSRSRTPANRIAPYTPVTPSSTPRGRSMARRASTSRSMSLSRPRSSSSSVSRLMNLRNRRVTVSSGPTSTGFLITQRRKRRKYKTKLEKFRQNAVYNGVQYNIEASGSIKDAQTIYLGHALPIYQVRVTAWWCVIRQLIKMAGGNVGELHLDTTLPGFGVGLVAGDVISVQYKATSASSTNSLTWTVPAVAVTLESVIETNFQTTAVDLEEVEWQYMTFVPVASSPLKQAQIKLDQCVLHIGWKSALKMQNRSVNTATDTTTDELDACPIYGKIYEGSGLGARFTQGKLFNPVATPLLSLISNSNTGVISAEAGTVNYLKEPVEYQSFENVKKIGKAHLGPGEIKTSMLFKVFAAKFGNLMRELSPNPKPGSNTNAGLKQLCRFSTYRMFGLEKMLDAVQSEVEAQYVNVAFENDNKIFMSCKLSNIQPTISYFRKINPAS